MSSVIGCPVPTAHQALVDAATQFCTETNVVQVTTYPTPVRAGISVYDLDLPQFQEPMRVLAAWLEGQPLRVLTDTQPGSGLTEDETAQPRGAPHSITYVDRGVVKLYPTPDTDAPALSFRVVTSPTPDARRLHNDLFYRWHDAVVSGALMRLTAIPAQPFTDPRVEARTTVSFWREVNRARIESRRNHTATSLRARARPFA